jgi:RHH-type transcriptional regulator, proline utilization regulon repressor / proline dehydrogenase / delta 1-pyrroline-5-carboxylate dehydrogenase
MREYCPVGELLPGMAYLVRRLLENTSNEGFSARQGHRRSDPGATAASPVGDDARNGRRGRADRHTGRQSSGPDPPAFSATRPTPTFAQEAGRAKMRVALANATACSAAAMRP